MTDSSRGTPHAGCVNVVGYHHVTSGLGEAARLMTRSLESAGVECRLVDVNLTDSPSRRSSTAPSIALADVTIAVVTATELPRVAEALPEPFDRPRYVIGYWFWELASVPAGHRIGLGFVDEIWVASAFIHSAYASLGHPCRLAPLRFGLPDTSAHGARKWRNQLDVGAGAFLVLASADLFSVPNRKNLIGAIRTFRRAFPIEEGDDVRLVVKTLNGHVLPIDVDAVRNAASSDARITIIDEHLPDQQHHDLIAAADCFLSLHRGEGLGLQLAAAMWLRTPVVATRYGGNLDFMDDTCALLVDVTMTPVRDGRGAYPEDAFWAEPDEDQAAQQLRRLAHDQALREAIAGRAYERMASQPSSAEFGTYYRSLLSRKHTDLK